MRALPAGWPSPSAKKRTPPVVYLRLPGSSWPPASSQGGESLPAGTTRVGEWTIDCDLDAPLMPGQVNASTKFTIAEASCTIPQPKDGLLAPWSPAGQAPPKSGACELVASYDGPTGATAFVLGKFVLDPIKGKLSDGFLTLTMVQDMVRLRKTHGMLNKGTNGTELLTAAAARNGYGITFTEGMIGLFGVYFSQKTDELTAMQEIARANLSAIYLSMDGTTIKALGPNYLLATGEPVETFDVLDSFEDLAWSQDPGGIADRVEVAYVQPKFDATPWSEDPNLAAAPVFTMPAGARIASGASQTFTFDPGTIVFPRGWAAGGQPAGYVNGTVNRDGSGGSNTIPVYVTQINTSTWQVTVVNSSFRALYLMAPYTKVEDGVIVPDINFPKNTRAVVVGTIDTATDSEPTVLAWGAGADDATNTLRFDFGRNVQTFGDAADRLNHIVGRVTQASWLVEDVNVVPHLGRELGDIGRLLLAKQGLDRKSLVTGIKTSGDSSGIRQSLSLALPS